MPFTFSHPAAVLPLSYLPKRFISMTGLVVGSMAPDFEYFIRMQDFSVYSHTIKGIFYFDLPVGILLAFLFHVIIRDSLIGNLPGFINRRLGSFKSFNWSDHFRQHFTVIAISIIIGTASHIAWDAFTHRTGYFVQLFSVLQKHISIMGHDIPMYDLMQHAGTVVGGLIVCYAVLQFPLDKTISAQRSILPFWIVVTLVMLLLVAAKLIRGLPYNDFDRMIIVAISGWLGGLLFASVLDINRISRGKDRKICC